jgi:hypothetical protein
MKKDREIYHPGRPCLRELLRLAWQAHEDVDGSVSEEVEELVDRRPIGLVDIRHRLGWLADAVVRI